MSKRRRTSQIMIPEAHGTMEQMRYAVAHQMGFVNVPSEITWWENLTPMQKSQVNGTVTKLLVSKAQVDMAKGIQIHQQDNM